MDRQRAILADYVDERITITGLLDRFDYGGNGTREWKNALFQDVFAEIEGKDVDLGHIWIQHADALKVAGTVCGDRIQCNCRVSLYKKRVPRPNGSRGMAVSRLSLSCPIEIEIIGQTVKGPIVATPQTDLGAASVELIEDVRRAAAKAGGWDDLQRLIDVLRGPGPQAA